MTIVINIIPFPFMFKSFVIDSLIAAVSCPCRNSHPLLCTISSLAFVLDVES
jgi:hypothetical protein